MARLKQPESYPSLFVHLREDNHLISEAETNEVLFQRTDLISNFNILNGSFNYENSLSHKSY